MCAHILNSFFISIIESLYLSNHLAREKLALTVAFLERCVTHVGTFSYRSKKMGRTGNYRVYRFLERCSESGLSSNHTYACENTPHNRHFLRLPVDHQRVYCSSSSIPLAAVSRYLFVRVRWSLSSIENEGCARAYSLSFSLLLS